MANILILGRDANRSSHLKNTLKRHKHAASRLLYYHETLRRVNADEKFDIVVCDKLEECYEHYDQFVHNIRTLLAPSLLIIAAEHASAGTAAKLNAVTVNFIDLINGREIWDELTILSLIATHTTK